MGHASKRGRLTDEGYPICLSPDAAFVSSSSMGMGSEFKRRDEAETPRSSSVRGGGAIARSSSTASYHAPVPKAACSDRSSSLSGRPELCVTRDGVEQREREDDPLIRGLRAAAPWPSIALGRAPRLDGHRTPRVRTPLWGAPRASPYQPVLGYATSP